MSHVDFKPDKMKIDFSNGFSITSIIYVIKQKRRGRKVLFEIGHKNSPLKLTLELDNHDDLNLRLKDINDNDYIVGPIPRNKFFNKRVLVVTETQKNQSTNLVELSLTLIIDKQNIIPLNDTFDADLGSESPVEFVIGSTLNHDENAAFIMEDLSMYNTTFTKEEIETVLVDLLDAEKQTHE